MLTFGSVCSGIEAASVAWHPLGWRAAWLAEIEPFPCAVLAHHYPAVPNLGDMTQIADMVALGTVEAPDIFCGGTPCQAFSVAGLRRSLDDARGNLSLTFCEIANAIDNQRRADGRDPCIVFWENVPGVLSTKDNAFGCFLAGLAGEDDPLIPPGGKWANAGAVFGPARAVAWRVLDAQYFGVAQRRRRVFVVASARDGFDPAAVLFEWDGVRRDTAPSREAGQESAAGTLRSTDGGSDVDHARAGHIRAFGNNQSGPIDVATARNACASASGRMDFETETFLVQPTHTRRAEGFDASEDGSGRGTPLVPVAYTTKLHNTQSNQAGKVYEEYSTSLDANSPPPAVFQPVAFDTTQMTSAQNRSNPQPGDPCHPPAAGAHAPAIAFSAKDYGGDAMHDLSPTLRAGGHSTSHANAGVMPAIAFHPTQDPISSTDGTTHGLGCGSSGGQASVAVALAFDSKESNTLCNIELSPCLTTNGDTGKAGGRIAVQTAMQVRRLTPRECERLQGFPDDYTLIPWRKKPASECPDGPRYKALGNSWAVPVVRWIGQRIARHVPGDTP